MKFLVAMVGSTVCGMIGGWLGGFVGMGASLVLGLVFSIAGWYMSNRLWREYLE